MKVLLSSIKIKIISRGKKKSFTAVAQVPSSHSSLTAVAPQVDMKWIPEYFFHRNHLHPKNHLSNCSHPKNNHVDELV
jgi:hypothetical protein